jgi:hypothetical protein
LTARRVMLVVLPRKREAAMSNAPEDLRTVRKIVMSLTGITNVTAVGITGDANHVDGYHLGRDRLKALGKLATDFSVVQFARDMAGLTNSASALDISLEWAKAKGGRDAATAFSNLMVADLRAGTPGSEVLRAINLSLDGTKAKRSRVDRRVGLAKTRPSTDTVDTHTHFEFFRDTEGTRDGAFLTLLRRRILQAQGRKEDDMLRDEKAKGADGFERSALTALFDLHNEMILGADFGRKNGAVNRLKRVETRLAESAAREKALSSAFQALAGNVANVDTDAVMAHIDKVAAAESATVQALHDEIAELSQQIAGGGSSPPTG